MDYKDFFIASIICIVEGSEGKKAIADAKELLDSGINLEEIHEVLLHNFNIKSAELLEGVYVYYYDNLSKRSETALIVDAKIQYYIGNCQNQWGFIE